MWLAPAGAAGSRLTSNVCLTDISSNVSSKAHVELILHLAELLTIACQAAVPPFPVKPQGQDPLTLTNRSRG